MANGRGGSRYWSSETWGTANAPIPIQPSHSHFISFSHILEQISNNSYCSVRCPFWNSPVASPASCAFRRVDYLYISSTLWAKVKLCCWNKPQSVHQVVARQCFTPASEISGTPWGKFFKFGIKLPTWTHAMHGPLFSRFKVTEHLVSLWPQRRMTSTLTLK